MPWVIWKTRGRAVCQGTTSRDRSRVSAWSPRGARRRVRVLIRPRQRREVRPCSDQNSHTPIVAVAMTCAIDQPEPASDRSPWRAGQRASNRQTNFLASRHAELTPEQPSPLDPDLLQPVENDAQDDEDEQQDKDQPATHDRSG